MHMFTSGNVCGGLSDSLTITDYILSKLDRLNSDLVALLDGMLRL